MSTHSFEIEPRPAAVGCGWQLHLFERDAETGELLEVAVGYFPVPADVVNLDDALEQAYTSATETGTDWLAGLLWA